MLNKQNNSYLEQITITMMASDQKQPSCAEFWQLAALFLFSPPGSI
jgi:hypothetical protein